MSALNVSSFIWGIADDVLRDVYVRGKYRDVILPMTVIRRLDAVLEPTKEDVLRMKERLDEAGIDNQDAALRQAAGEAFYNTSPFRLRDLTSRGQQQRLRADFETYLYGFSPNVLEVLDKFKFHHQIPTLVEADALGFLVEKFGSYIPECPRGRKRSGLLIIQGHRVRVSHSGECTIQASLEAAPARCCSHEGRNSSKVLPELGVTNFRCEPLVVSVLSPTLRHRGIEPT